MSRLHHSYWPSFQWPQQICICLDLDKFKDSTAKSKAWVPYPSMFLTQYHGKASAYSSCWPCWERQRARQQCFLITRQWLAEVWKSGKRPQPAHNIKHVCTTKTVLLAVYLEAQHSVLVHRAFCDYQLGQGDDIQDSSHHTLWSSPMIPLKSLN